MRGKKRLKKNDERKERRKVLEIYRGAINWKGRRKSGISRGKKKGRLLFLTKKKGKA